MRFNNDIDWEEVGESVTTIIDAIGSLFGDD